MSDDDQLAALADLHRSLQRERIAYWLFGGWAVDFHAGRVTRPHGDLDIAVWSADLDRLAALLEVESWTHLPDAGEDDGYTCYERGSVRLEVAFLARDERGRVYTPLRNGRGEWPEESFDDDVLELAGVQACVIGRDALIADKSALRQDPSTTTRDRADLRSLAASLPDRSR